MGEYIPPADQVIVEPSRVEIDSLSHSGGIRMQSIAAPARPPHFAEREELDAALKAGTIESLLLFIERHPQSRYRAEAEAALLQLGATLPSR